MKWQPKDVIALVVILIAGGLLFTGTNGRVGWALIVVVCAYYGIDLSPWFRIGRNQKPKKGGNE
ncbi:hypothetical protein ES703_106816 [subsurface metagenome]